MLATGTGYAPRETAMSLAKIRPISIPVRSIDRVTRLASVLALLVLSACMSQTGPSASRADAPAGDRPRGPKVLTLAIPAEPDTLIRELAFSRTGGLTTLANVVHNRLVLEADDFTWVTELATEPV